MKLIVGLGNPGKQYEKTRHNVGYMVIDTYLKQMGEKPKLDMRFESEIHQALIHQEKVIFLKPVTYMNLSGQAIQKVISYFDIDLKDVLVFVDDVNLETGRLRLRLFGGHGGHNGLRNINDVLGTNRFKRVRIGVDNNPSIPLDRYVLGQLSKDDVIAVDIAVTRCLDMINDFISGKPFTDMMTTYNTQT